MEENQSEKNEMLKQYDFRNGVRGKYVKRLTKEPLDKLPLASASGLIQEDSSALANQKKCNSKLLQHKSC
jgi:hypothetical protein